jgi:hypothetical protein
MVGIDEELSVAKSAKAAIDALSTLGPNPSNRAFGVFDLFSR